MSNLMVGNLRRKDHPSSVELAFTPEVLAATQEKVEQDASDAGQLIDALGELIEVGKIEGTEEHARGIVVATGNQTKDGKRAIEGLMYTEATEMHDGRIAAAASLSIWVAGVNEYLPDASYLRNRSMTTMRAQDIRRWFYGISITNVDETLSEPGQVQGHFGLTTNSATIITPVGNQDGDIQFPFHHGDWRDALRVSELDIPPHLKQTVIASVMGHHATQQLEAQQTASELQVERALA